RATTSMPRPSPTGANSPFLSEPISPPPPAGEGRVGGLRREPFDAPATRGLPRVADAVVQPVVAMHPELAPLGNDPIATPVRRQRHFLSRIRSLQRRDLRLERGAVEDDLTLRRGQGADLAGEWAPMK